MRRTVTSLPALAILGTVAPVNRFALVAAVWVVAVGLARAQESSAEILSALNVERARMELERVALSAPLQRLAQARATEITAGEVLDFEPSFTSELVAAARGLGYDGTLVQELTSVDDSLPCEIVRSWKEGLGLSDAYRRPEVRDIGVGFGVLGERALTVVVVGVPPSHDALRKRWPGRVPREWLTADLLREIERARVGMGRPPFVDDEELTSSAQELADEILAGNGPYGPGRREVPEGTLLYFKAGPGDAPYWGKVLKVWLATEHGTFARFDAAPVGAGLASRGREGYLEAVWTVLVGKTPSGRE